MRGGTQLTRNQPRNAIVARIMPAAGNAPTHPTTDSLPKLGSQANRSTAKPLPAPATIAYDVKSPALFCGGYKGMRGGIQQTRMQPRNAIVARIMPAAAKNGQSRGFDQRERVAFSAYSFLKRVGAGVGVHNPHPVSRNSIRGAVCSPVHAAASSRQSLRQSFGLPPPFTQGRLSR